MNTSDVTVSNFVFKLHPFIHNSELYKMALLSVHGTMAKDVISEMALPRKTYPVIWAFFLPLYEIKKELHKLL